MIGIVNILYWIVRRYPHIKRNLAMAHQKDTPQKFVRKCIVLAIYTSVAITILCFFMFDKYGVNLAILLPVFAGSIVLMFMFFLQAPTVTIRKREREINKEVLFAGRYILVKLQSGTPLFNTLIDASKGYGICAKYFREIVDDITMGTPIEEALTAAREYNASEKFKLILTELVTTLKTGADIAPSLQNVLHQITQEQVIEIKEYAKKLNSFMMMYIIIAAVVPSLGTTFFILVAGFIGFNITPVFIILAVAAIAVVQYMFLSLFKSIRPAVNL
ncbi:MAG: type II secretion system F family protein [archaeon]